ncbi:MAG: hypothetical protein DCC55_03685 [Chloroflexi bacterium]|nr:MAG: hypothetical protein DCC55_03685 [Chloroflexota bacterium]
MNEERMQILRMLQEGRITVEEAARLIAALSTDEPAVPVSRHTPVSIPVEEIPPQGSPRVAPLFSWAFRYGLFCNLENTRFEGAHLDNAKIWFSNLDSADLRDANLQDAWVVAANLDNANLVGANLEGAKIAASNLDHADLAGADLRGAVIIAANLERCDLRGADLRGQALIGVSMARYRAQTPVTTIVAEE